MCTIGDKLYSVIDEKLEIIAYNYKDIQLTNWNYSIIRKDIFNFYLVDNLWRNYYNYSFNIIYSKWSYLICDSSSEQRLVLNDGTLLTWKNNLTNVFFSHFDYNKWYALFYATWNLVPWYWNVYYRYIYKIDKNWNTTLVKTFQTYGNFDEFEHINKFNNNINELNLNSEIIYKNVKINWKFNFIKKDWILLVKSPSYNKLLTLIDNYEKLIKNHLVKEFNSETWEWEIKLLNNYYKVIRNKNDYWYYDYKIDF
jgi:hypothetical protein